MMKPVLGFILLFAMLLTACAGNQGVEALETESLRVTTQEIPVVQVNETDEPAEIPTEAPMQAPVEDNSTQALPSTTAAENQSTSSSSGAGAGPVTYRIVPEESRVTYEVNETFLEGNRLGTAVGVTRGIDGTLQVDLANPQNSRLDTITIDISQFVSDSSRRDNAIRGRYLESGRFPLAVFQATGIEGLPTTVEEGVDYPLTISGNLTIREVTRPVTFNTVVRMESDRIIGQAQTTILMSDFGFGPISIIGMLNTEDEVRVAFDFVAIPTN